MLEIKNLSIKFSSYSNGLSQKVLPAIQSLDLNVDSGEVLAVVGQSGSGKSLLAHALLGVLPKNAVVSGDLVFKGEHLTPASIKSLRGREIALVPQSMTYLNPLRHVGVQITRAAELSGLHPRSAYESTRAALNRYRLDETVARRFPFQLSGGMARRILTATATIGNADLILADEPTNGLDPATANETLEHLREIADAGKAVILITHDIEAALKVSDRISIFCGGVTVEEARLGDFNETEGLLHPYSKALWNALPGRGFVYSLNGAHTPDFEAEGCPFAGFCNTLDEDCQKSAIPELRTIGNGKVRCHNA